MSSAHHPDRRESFRAVARMDSFSRGNHCLISDGRGNIACRWRILVLSWLVILSWGASMVGCKPAQVNADPPAQRAPEGLSVSHQSNGARPRPTALAVATSTEALASYDLEFEARANPFGAPEPQLNARSNGAEASPMADVKLVGLMSDGTESMAVINVNGAERIVFAGTNLGSDSGADGLGIVEIRESEIVVEQHGRQWIVPLPRP